MLPNRELRSVIANYAHLATSALVFAGLTPIVLASVGPVAYGYWVILNSLGGYLLLADLGISSAVARYTAVHDNERDAEAVSLNRFLSTLAVPVAGLIVLVVAATFLAAPAIPGLFHVSAPMAHEVSVAFVLTGINAAALLLTLFVANINYGCNRLDVSKGSSIAGQMVMAATTIYLVRRGYSVTGLATATLAGTATALVANLVYLRSARRDISVNPLRFDASVLREVGGYSLRTFVLGMASRVAYSTDALIIGVFIGASSVASYELTYKVCFFATYLFSSVSSAAFPRFSAWTSTGASANVRRDGYLQVVRLSMLIAVPVGICLAAFTRPFLSLWAGPGMYAGTAVLLALLAIHVAHALGTPAVMFLQSAGRNRELTYADVANAALNIVLSILLVRRFGVAGVAVATLIAQFSTSFWVTQRLPARMLGIRLAEYWKTSVLVPVAMGVPAAVGAAIVTAAVPVDSFVQLVAGCAVVFVLYAATFVVMTRLTSEESPWLVQSAS